MKKIISVLMAITISVLVFFGYQKYERSKTIEHITPIIKITSIKTEKIFSDRNNTYGEVMKSLETDISELDKNIDQMRLILNDKNKDLISPSIIYIEKCKKMLELDLVFLKLKLDFEVNMKGSSLRSISDAIENLKKMSENRKDAKVIFFEINKARDSIALFIDSTALISQETMDKTKKYFSEANSTKKR